MQLKESSITVWYYNMLQSYLSGVLWVQVLLQSYFYNLRIIMLFTSFRFFGIHRHCIVVDNDLGRTCRIKVFTSISPEVKPSRFLSWSVLELAPLLLS